MSRSIRMAAAAAFLLLGVAMLISADPSGATKPRPISSHVARTRTPRLVSFLHPVPRVQVDTATGKSVTTYQLSVPANNQSWCLDANSRGIKNGDQVQLWACNSKAPAQRWIPVCAISVCPGNDEIYVFENDANPHYCLDADSTGIGDNGDKVELWSCNDSTTEQQWNMTAMLKVQAQEAWATIPVVANQKFCLDVDTPTHVMPHDGTKVQLWGCDSQDWQQVWFSLM